MIDSRADSLRKIKEDALLPKPKKNYQIPAKSKKRMVRDKLEKENAELESSKRSALPAQYTPSAEDYNTAYDIKPQPKEVTEITEMELWYQNVRKQLSGFCACGCGNKSQKNDDTFFRGSCCHVFAKSKFQSIKYHPSNFVERAMFGGCHDVLDQTSIDRWVNMADWEDIKSKFHILAPLLTDEEKATKFYSKLERLVHEN